MQKNTVTYKDAGVNKEAGYESVKLMKEYVKKTFTKGVVSDIGGFGGLFSIAKDNYHEPVLVSGTDGVGTKLMIAFMMDKHDTIGEDCVAMCVNDILCQGAKPLFFLDYIATGKIHPNKIAEIVKGISNGCIKAGASLIGGETAEMPGLYSQDEYDMAGFAVGIVDKSKIINGSKIQAHDVLIGLPSSGIHSNGYSLVRKVLFDLNNYKTTNYIKEFQRTLGEEIIEPTRIYVNPVSELIEKFQIKGIAHITGGGFYENIPRIFPDNISAQINVAEIEKLPIFDFLQKTANIETKEMYSTFNMGIGLVMAVKAQEVDAIMQFLTEKNEKPVIIGQTIKGNELKINF